MIHQPSAGYEGTSTEVQIYLKEFLRTKRNMNEIMKKHTGRSLEELEKDTDRDNYMSATEAKDYGLIDHMLEKMPAGGIGLANKE